MSHHLPDLSAMCVQGSRQILALIMLSPTPRPHAPPQCQSITSPTMICPLLDDLWAMQAAEFWSIGPTPFPVSAISGSGTGDMMDALVDLLPPPLPQDPEPAPQEEPLRVAIIGRPNVGKSSLVNALVSTGCCAAPGRHLSCLTACVQEQPCWRSCRKHAVLHSGGLQSGHTSHSSAA